jgi:hypothetical protein
VQWIRDVENRAEQMPGMTPVNLIVHDSMPA